MSYMKLPDKNELTSYSLNFLISITLLTIATPILLIALLATYLQDKSHPLYLARRVGKHGKPYTMYKIRSMVTDADKTGVDSTKLNDERLTTLGRFLRICKIDELPQFINVVLGQMSLVGPRPNVEREVLKYTINEKKLLSVAPGITDISSITFSDLNEFLSDKGDANLAYEQYIRPWKSRLGLFYIKHKSISLDLKIVLLTALNFISRRTTLNILDSILNNLNCEEELRLIASRKKEPYKASPP
jgi:lipopolysaccharide/colanic/teichoic acid biosynthesis glycosyltransferase